MVDILTDPGCGIPERTLYSLGILPLSYAVIQGSKEIRRAFSIRETYLNGDVSINARPQIDSWSRLINRSLKLNRDVLYIAGSQDTSNSIEIVELIKELLIPLYPDRKIEIISTNKVDRELGNIVKRANELAKLKLSLEEIERILKEENFI